MGLIFTPQEILILSITGGVPITGIFIGLYYLVFKKKIEKKELEKIKKLYPDKFNKDKDDIKVKETIKDGKEERTESSSRKEERVESEGKGRKDEGSDRRASERSRKRNAISSIKSRLLQIQSSTRAKADRDVSKKH